MFGFFFSLLLLSFSLFCGNESPYPNFLRGAPSPCVVFNAPACSQLPFVEEHSSRYWLESPAPLLHEPQLKLPGWWCSCTIDFTTHTC